MASLSVNSTNLPIPKLNGENWPNWNKRCGIVLLSKGLMSYVDGTIAEITQPTIANAAAPSDPERAATAIYTAWLEKDQQARAIILTAIDDNMLQYIQINQTSRSMWQKFKDLHTSTDTVYTEFSPTQQLTSLRYIEGTPILDHINAVNEILAKLTDIGEGYTDIKSARALLATMPQEGLWGSVVITCLSLGGSLTFAGVVSRLNQEHSRRTMHAGATARALYGERGGTQGRGLERDRNRRNDGNGGVGNANKDYSDYTCRYVLCGKKGHIERNCPLKKQHTEEMKAKSSRAHVASAADPQPISPDDIPIHLAYAATTTPTTPTSAPLTDAIRIIIDSGCTDHVFRDRTAFSSYTPFATPYPLLRVGNDAGLPIVGRGTVSLRVFRTGRYVGLSLSNAIHVPDITTNLISGAKLDIAGATLNYGGGLCVVRKDHRTEFQAMLRNNLYEVDAHYLNGPHALVGTTLNIWHARLGHLNFQDVASLEKMTDDMVIDGKKSKAPRCDSCEVGKFHRQPFPTSESASSLAIHDLIVSDLRGPFEVRGIGGTYYAMTTVEVASHFAFAHVLKTKDEAGILIKDLILEQERAMGKPIKVLRTDGGGEFVAHGATDWFAEQGIVHQKTMPHTPQQNGISERIERTIQEGVRTILHDSGMPKEYWPYAWMYIAYTRNRSPTSALQGKTPYEAYYGKKPKVGHLRAFGAKCYTHVPDTTTRLSLDPRSIECRFIGYPTDQKGWIVATKANGKIFTSRDVNFWEDEPAPLPAIIPTSEPTPSAPAPSITATEAPVQQQDAPVAPALDVVQLAPIAPLRSSRNHRVPPRFVNGASDQEVTAALRRGSSRAFVAYTPGVPKTYAQATKSENAKDWRKAMEAEMDALKELGTFELCELPEGRAAIGGKWVYKAKMDAAGNFQKYKARFVANGSAQVEGLDYEETFAPVARYTSIKLLVAVTAAKDLEFITFDVKNAYLYGKLDEEVYMKQPKGFVDEKHPQHVCRLIFSLYGLKQSGRNWNHHYHDILIELGFIQLKSDPCVYIRMGPDGVPTYVSIYVDDGGSFSADVVFLEEFLNKLEKRVVITKDLTADSYLGVRIQRDRDNLLVSLDQKAYLTSIIDDFGLTDANPVYTPLAPGQRLSTLDCPVSAEDKAAMAGTPYLQLLGKLLFAAANTRPDFAFAVHALARYGSNPGPVHWTALKRIARYAKGTLDHKLWMGGSPSVELTGYVDADWASNEDDRKSVSGFIFYIGKSPVSWSSTSQKTVALSTAEAEYVSLSNGIKEALWLRSFLVELGIPVDGPTTIFCDSQSAIKISNNPVNHSRVKHIDIRHHFIRDHIAKGDIAITYIPTEDMTADILTKGLARPAHEKHTRGLRVLTADALEGGC